MSPAKTGPGVSAGGDGYRYAARRGIKNVVAVLAGCDLKQLSPFILLLHNKPGIETALICLKVKTSLSDP
jgi:hypothetical protein